MPYIKRLKRDEIDPLVKQVLGVFQKFPDEERDGCLNYFFTKVLKDLYEPSYFNYERVMGLLSCIQHEFYRRWVAVYEDTKKEMHGDI
ncbi:MAG: hypothetical protein QXN08_00870 [Nitrososphaerales archaeon]